MNTLQHIAALRPARKSPHSGGAVANEGLWSEVPELSSFFLEILRSRLKDREPLT
jgi:hypothetical protein